jgi:hypothetical protein
MSSLSPLSPLSPLSQLNSNSNNGRKYVFEDYVAMHFSNHKRGLIIRTPISSTSMAQWTKVRWKQRRKRRTEKGGDCCCHALEKMGELITLMHSFDYDLPYVL